MEVIHIKATADVSEADGELERFANRLSELERFGEGSGVSAGVGSGLAELEDVFERASAITRNLVGDLESLQSSGLRPLPGVGASAARSVRELGQGLDAADRSAIKGAGSFSSLKGTLAGLAQADMAAAQSAKAHAQGLSKQREEAIKTAQSLAVLAQQATRGARADNPQAALGPQGRILLPGQGNGQGLAVDDLARVAEEVAKFKATVGGATPELDKLRDTLDDFDSVAASGAAGIEGQEETLRGLVGTLQTVGGAYDEVGDLLRDVRKRADEYGFSAEEQAAALNSVLGAAKSSNLPLAKQARIMEELIIETQDAARAQELYADALDLVARRGGRVEDQISKLTDASKGHTSSLSELGPRARALASGYENIRDRQLKGRLVLEAYNTEARRTPDALDKINDSLTIGQAKIGAFMARLGPAGLLLGAFAAGVAASVGAAWNAAIAVTERGIDTIRERSEAAAAAASRFEASKGAASAGIVGSVLGREGTAGIERAMAARLEGLAETYDKAQSGADGFTFSVVRNMSAISAWMLTALPFVGSMAAVAQAENAAAEEAKLIRPALLAQSEAYSQAARAAATMTTRDRERIIATGEVIVREDGRAIAVRMATAAEREAAQAEAEHIQQLENLATASAAGVDQVGRLSSAFGGLSSSISGATGQLLAFVQSQGSGLLNRVLVGSGLKQGALAGIILDGVKTARKRLFGTKKPGGGGGGGAKDPIADIRREIDEVIAAASKARELQELLRSTSLDTVDGGLERLREEYRGLTEAIDAYQIALADTKGKKAVTAILDEIDLLLDQRLALEDFIEQLEDVDRRLSELDALNKASAGAAEIEKTLTSGSESIRSRLKELNDEVRRLEDGIINAGLLGFDETAQKLGITLSGVHADIALLNAGLGETVRIEQKLLDVQTQLERKRLVAQGPDAIEGRMAEIRDQLLLLQTELDNPVDGGLGSDKLRRNIGQLQGQLEDLEEALPEAKMRQFSNKASADLKRFGTSFAESIGSAVGAGEAGSRALTGSLKGAVQDMIPLLAGLASAYLAAQSLNPVALFAATALLAGLAAAATSAFSGKGRRASASSSSTSRRDLSETGDKTIVINLENRIGTKRLQSEFEGMVSEGQQRRRISPRRTRRG